MCCPDELRKIASPTSDKAIALCFFSLPVKEAKKWKQKNPGKRLNGSGCDWVCICGCKRQKSGTGWSNLAQHVKTDHKDHLVAAVSKWLRDLTKPSLVQVASEKGSTITTFISFKSNNIFCWMNWVVTKLKPFSFVEEEETREYSKLKPMCSETLIKYINLVCREVEQEISKRLPKKFAIIFDGWSWNSYHLVGSFATYCDSKSQQVEYVLLGFTVMTLNHAVEHSEDGFSETEPIVMNFDAQSYYNLVTELLSFYDKSIEDVSVFIGDNCSVNKSLADLACKTLVGCASHRLHLAVCLFVEPFERLID